MRRVRRMIRRFHISSIKSVEMSVLIYSYVKKTKFVRQKIFSNGDFSGKLSKMYQNVLFLQHQVSSLVLLISQRSFFESVHGNSRSLQGSFLQLQQKWQRGRNTCANRSSNISEHYEQSSETAEFLKGPRYFECW